MKQIAIIGGSRGIGHEILKQNLPENKVINLSRSAPAIDHENLTHYNVDVLTDELPDLDSVTDLIYCPGSITLKPLTSLSTDDFLNDYQINVIGAVKVIKKYYRLLRKAEASSILLFSTVAVGQGMPFHSSIAAAKSAVEGLTRSLAAEFAPRIRVNCIAPTVTDTDLASNILRNDKMRESAENRHPLKMILNVSDIAGMAGYLISDQARAITGQVIGVDAGLSVLRV
jgi:NAD(P)-dependent dehydrogenase (short-subunit alcohol dehydrogenase family)